MTDRDIRNNAITLSSVLAGGVAVRDRLKELVLANKRRFATVLAAMLLAWTSFAAACLVTGAYSLLKGASAVLTILLALGVVAAIRYRDARR